MASDADFSVKMGERLKTIKHVVLVLSGKGGVGKSTVSAQLALGLVEKGHKVGLLDADLCGPSIPHMLGLEGRDVHQCPEGWVPVHTDAEKKLSAISIAFLLGSRDDPVIWRGPKKTAMIRQFLADVCWGELDYLIVDTPPGTSDEHLTIVECFRGFHPDGAVLVTTPQGVAISDVRREASFCKKVELPILGIVENMSGFACPHCAECTNIFSTGGGERLAENLEVPFLGRVPLDPTLGASLEKGENFLQKAKESPAFPAILSIVDKIESRST